MSFPLQIQRGREDVKLTETSVFDRVWFSAVSIPVMAKCRIGHIAEAQVSVMSLSYLWKEEKLTILPFG